MLETCVADLHRRCGHAENPTGHAPLRHAVLLERISVISNEIERLNVDPQYPQGLLLRPSIFKYFQKILSRLLPECRAEPDGGNASAFLQQLNRAYTVSSSQALPQQ
jgi:hypothetical protein